MSFQISNYESQSLSPKPSFDIDRNKIVSKSSSLKIDKLVDFGNKKNHHKQNTISILQSDYIVRWTTKLITKLITNKIQIQT